ncbi:fungal specific transcription factor domain-containing protein [Fusarium mexicanum]|uniref:Fungal specific transcription factor domain-containing protein n=1 Tax=Fusarium mexicanum TaxID=751941 RepID=A0A8H5JES1_9HYPO|nr:fungal specific transcription factor domain-containing protein [Fusarium mexicanum]
MSSLANLGLARYACDYCKQKKFRCSKELPKCSACRPWPGPCNYSRDKPALKSSVNEKATRAPLDLTNWQSIERLNERLQKVEEAVQALTPTVAEGVEAVNHGPSTNYQQVVAKECRSQDGMDSSPSLSVGDMTSFSFLKDTSITNTTIGSSPLHQHAAKEFQYLSDSLTTAGVTGKIYANTGFFVPSKGEGYQMIGRFLESARLGETFFITPSESLLIQTIFRPETVSKKAWVVYINYMIVAMLAHNEAVRAQKYRDNMKLALNDSRIFLEPQEVNLQALIMLAIHGEDYASPNQSWMLVGHACRQAEALRLHSPTEPEYKKRQRKLSLFWLLFAVDKSCALAFGRPCSLPSARYSHVPLPDLRYLTKFQPHIDSPDAERRAQKLVFGGHMFLARIELAQMIGASLDSRHIPETEDSLRKRLGDWFARTNKILSDTLQNEKSFSSPNELREMELGISTIKFEYLHVSMVLLKSHSPSANLRLETVRESISLLPSMISNWTSIYNSMVWHLLYYPFIPYFIIFENLVHKHALLSNVTIQRDFELLSMTVSYYATMRDQLQILAPLCKRLENTAAVFFRLAKQYVDSSNIFTPTQQLSAKVSVQSSEDIQMELGSEVGIDLEHYIQWLPPSIISPQGSRTTVIPDKDPAHGPSTSASSESVQRESRGTKRPFDVMFDWFAWDVYYGEQNGDMA